MDNAEISNKIINWAYTHRRKLLFLVVFIIVIAAIGNFVTKNALVNITVTGSFEQKNLEVYAISQGKMNKLGGTGLHVVSRGTTSIIATSGNYARTETALTIPWYGYTEKQVTLERDRNATKVAYNSSLGVTCATYMPTFDKLGYYNCNKPITLVKYQLSQDGSWINQKIASINDLSGPVRPYAAGVIGIVFYPSAAQDIASTKNITAVNSKGERTIYNTPSEIPDDSLTSSTIFTNTSDTSDNRFVVVAESGDIYIGTPGAGNKVDYKRVAKPTDYNPDYNQTLCSLSKETLYCYRGPTAYGDVSAEHDFSKVTQSQIMSYSFATGAETTTKMAHNLFALDDIYVTTNGEIYAKYYSQLYHFAKIDGKYDTQTISQNVNAVTTKDDTLYYVQYNGVFATTSALLTTARQIFYSPNIQPKSLYAVDGRIYIIGLNPSYSKTTTYAYLLNEDFDTTPGDRLIDKVPFAPTSDTEFTSSDLVGDTIYISLDVDVKGRSQSEINASFSQKKINTLKYLTTIGIDPDKTPVVFTM